MAADKKQPYNWTKVIPGDIISFRYKSIHTNKIRTHTILVLNPRLPVSLKDGSQKKQLIGIKLEESNLIDMRLTDKEITIFEKIGTLDIVDAEHNIFKLTIDKKFIVNNIIGVKQRAWKILSNSLKILGQYRTYDFNRAKRSAVYLEPIRLFTKKYRQMIQEEKEKLKNKESNEDKL